jgi:hypothetical protein
MNASDSSKNNNNLRLTLSNLSKDNEELRAYIEVLKAALDSRALQLGLGDKKV